MGKRGSSKGPGRLGSPDVVRVERLNVLWSLPRSQSPPRCARAPGMWAPLAYPVPPARLRKLQKLEGSFKKAKENSTTIKTYGWYSGFCLGATVGQVWTAWWYLKYMLPPNSFKWEGPGRVPNTCYYRTVLWEGSPGSSNGPGRLRSPNVARVER